MRDDERPSAQQAREWCVMARNAAMRDHPRTYRIWDMLLGRLAECERLGLRLRRLRLTVSEWRDLYLDHSTLPDVPSEGHIYLFCGYPIVVNSDRTTQGSER